MLVWLAISSRDISTPYFFPSGLAVKQNVHLKECIIKRLTPFIKKHHPEGNFVFWPDLASAHYAKSVTSYLISKDITFVQKADNPPAVPELRLVEYFWSILKGMVYKNNWQATSVDELKQRVKYCLKKVDVNAVQNMFGGVYRKLDFVRRNGEASRNCKNKLFVYKSTSCFLFYQKILINCKVRAFQKKSQILLFTR